MTFPFYNENDGSHVGVFELKVLNKTLTEICKFRIFEEHRHKGHGKKMLLYALSLVETPCAIATVRVDNTHWVTCNIDCGFRIIHRIYKDTGDLYLFLRSKQFLYPR